MDQDLSFEARAQSWVGERTRSVESLEVARSRLLGHLADSSNQLISQDINRALWVLELERSRVLKTMGYGVNY